MMMKRDVKEKKKQFDCHYSHQLLYSNAPATPAMLPFKYTAEYINHFRQ